MTPQAHETLRRNGLALCLNDDLFDPTIYAVTGPFAYFRFHRGLYEPDDLTIARELSRNSSRQMSTSTCSSRTRTIRTPSGPPCGSRSWCA